MQCNIFSEMQYAMQYAIFFKICKQYIAQYAIFFLILERSNFCSIIAFSIVYFKAYIAKTDLYIVNVYCFAFHVRLGLQKTCLHINRNLRFFTVIVLSIKSLLVKICLKILVLKSKNQRSNVTLNWCNFFIFC